MPEPRKTGSRSVAVLERLDGTRIGRVVGFARGEARVDFDGNRRGPLVARVAAALDDAALEQAARDHQEAVLMFEDGDPTRPVLIVLLCSATPLVDAALAGAVPPGRRTARVDGHRVEIEAREEVVLRCGKASLTLRRDGKVVLRGVHVVTQGDAVQRIRGGKVQIN